MKNADDTRSLPEDTDSLYRHELSESYWFFSEIPLRFADHIWNGSIPSYYLLTLFEECRFAILKDFRHYCREKNGLATGKTGEEIRFVVTQMHFAGMPCCCEEKKLKVRTRLVVQSAPMLKFIHCISDGIRCEITVAFIDEESRLIRRWDPAMYRDMLWFVFEKGERDAFSE